MFMLERYLFLDLLKLSPDPGVFFVSVSVEFG